MIPMYAQADVASTRRATFAEEVTPQSVSHLKIISNVKNNCQPRAECILFPNSFLVNVFTFEGDQYKQKGSGFPGSANGWTVDFSPPPQGVQYNVNQAFLPGRLNTTYSKDCQGSMMPGENKTCTISNTAFSTSAHLRIITSIKNNCLPKADCQQIVPGLFNVNVFTFEGDQYKQKGSGFPGSANGWTVDFSPPPQGVQYNVNQFGPQVKGKNIEQTYSSGCQGTLMSGSNNICYIFTGISNANSTTGASR